MKRQGDLDDAARVASAIDADIMALPTRNTPNMRAVRRTYSGILKHATPALVLRLAGMLCRTYEYRWFAYELIKAHRAAFERLEPAELERLGRGINSWWTVDAFARTLSGPAWLNRQVSDKLILKWARSRDRWWRRAALVSTVALNMRSHGGNGDAPRTLRVCRVLADDPDDMITQAMSWALRELVPHEPEAVRDFLEEYDGVLPARVMREVKNKLRTGLKNPKPAHSTRLPGAPSVRRNRRRWRT
jgi:3-methyladenine DNA glycosylase AlkD